MSGAHRASPRAAAIAILLAGLLVAACGAPAGPTPVPQDGTRIDLIATEFAFDPDTVRVPPGPVTFQVDNRGVIEHELKVYDGDRLLGEARNIRAGSSARLDVTVEPGTYLLTCRIPGHEEAGMHGVLEVGS
jgi:iron uptake system component EfeO